MPQIKPINWALILTLMTIMFKMILSNMSPILNKISNKKEKQNKQKKMTW